MSPPPSLLHLILLLLLLLLLLSSTTTTSHPCPPFTTTPPPYPFSTTPNSGHPSFQIKCHPPPLHATISINNLTFTILKHDPTTTTTLTPNYQTTLPTHPINFSNSPFKPTDSTCSRLTYLHPCNPKNCTHNHHFTCEITKNPLTLIQPCPPTHPPQLSQQDYCQPDILGFLQTFLKLGIETEFEQDSYFNKCKSCKGVCGFNSTDPTNPFLCIKTQNPQKPTSKTHNLNIPIISLTLVLCILLIILVTTYITKRRINNNSSIKQYPMVANYLNRHRSATLLPPVFAFDELKLATNNFDPDNKIGSGGFGSVYKGCFQENRVYAIKFLHKQNPSTKSFCNEILILSSLNHPNLVKLHGYCSDPRGLLLVYEYVSNGTLSDHLHVYKIKCLTWQTRLDIALQIATAIEYLHCMVVPPIVHRDITSNNVFVDKDMRVRVGDFGLSRLLDLDRVCTGPQGTPGYLDPDYYRSFQLTEKSDIYSFGVVLLELVTGMKAVDVKRDKREMTLADMAVAKIQMGLLAEVIDPRLATVDGGAVSAVAELSFRCVAADRDDRPDAKEVVAELRRIKGRTSRGGVVVRAGNSSNVVVPDGGPGMMD
ncbi:LEAF RUST 10 DISEASE-RESISTANCE LOCUS RECEPTOR-LIKE PROTEIN KINASE-like 1.5 [Bidens hawaiensis]|uniref:LEAF RUST 10 DISEASE-RESISTANCE LOCUS RECEPTOR-LIKE PROTEIN KINASE-like 1.5 n=1 Tax=Bidens hawaiensis TaxID=980011 RepID=UPI00404AEEF0